MPLLVLSQNHHVIARYEAIACYTGRMDRQAIYGTLQAITCMVFVADNTNKGIIAGYTMRVERLDTGAFVGVVTNKRGCLWCPPPNEMHSTGTCRAITCMVFVGDNTNKGIKA